MTGDVWGYLFGSVFAFAATAYTAWQTRRAKQAQVAVEKVRADGEAYERAQEINKQIVDNLRAEVARLNEALDKVRAQLTAEADHSDELDVKVNLLQLSVNRLSRLLEQHNIAIPIWSTG